MGTSVLIHIGDAEHNAWRDGDVLAARTERDTLAVHAQHIVKSRVPPHGLGRGEFADIAHADLRLLWKDMTVSAASPIPSGPNLDAWWERARELGLSPEVHRRWPFTNVERARHLAFELSTNLDAVTAVRWSAHPATVNRKRKIDWRKHVLPHASVPASRGNGAVVPRSGPPSQSVGRVALDLDVVDHRRIVIVDRRIDVGLFIERVDGRPVRPSGQGRPT